MKKHLLLSIYVTLINCAHAINSLTVCTATWPPYSYVEQGQIKGLHVDLVAKTLKHMGIPYKFKMVPWGRIAVEVQHKHCDLIFSGSHRADREIYAFYPDEPLEFISTDIVTTQSIQKSFQPTPHHPFPEPIGSPHGYSATHIFQEKKYIVDATAIDHAHDIEKLKLGRVKSIAITQDAFKELRKKNQVDKKNTYVIFQKNVIPAKPYYVLVAKHVGGTEAKALEFTHSFSKALKETKEVN